MSIKLMSAIFETEFRDLHDADGNTTKAATAKIVCLALADHANDEGEGAYPGLDKMTVKTALTKQCVINTYDALKHNGIITLVGQSRRGTNNYTVNPSSFPRMLEGKPRLLVISVDQQGNLSLPEGVIPVDPNHTLTIPKTSNNDEFQNQPIPDNYPLDWYLSHNVPVPEGWKDPSGDVQRNDFEKSLGFGSLPWGTGDWVRFGKWVVSTYDADQLAFQKYAEWRKGDGKYNAMNNKQIRLNPMMFVDTGYPSYLASASMYQSKDKSFGL